MKNNLKNKIEKKRKTNVNITIDVELLEELNSYKEKEDIAMLSPMINEMLWQWLKEEEKQNA